MFNPKLIAAIKRVIPTTLFDRLDPFEATIRKFVEVVGSNTRAGERVLDAGAGESRFRPVFAHARYVGVDFALGDPEWNYSRLDAVGRLEELPFPDSSFDRVISIVVLEHTPEPARVIAEFKEAGVIGPYTENNRNLLRFKFRIGTLTEMFGTSISATMEPRFQFEPDDFGDNDTTLASPKGWKGLNRRLFRTI